MNRSDRSRSRVGLAFSCTGPLLLLMAFAACRDKDPAPAAGAAPSVASSVAAPSPSPSPSPSSSVAVAAPASVPAVEDAGVEKAPGKARRLAAKPAAEAPVEAVVAPPSTPAEAAPAEARKRKKGPDMGNDLPYGATGAQSGAAVLKKAPLPAEDPWVKPGAATVQ
jgi:hypothetical protein